MTARPEGARAAGRAVAASVFAAVGYAAACGSPDKSLPTRRDATAAAPAPSVACGGQAGGIRSCTYVVAGTQVRATDSVGTLTQLAVWQDGAWRPLPRFYGSALWNGCYLSVDDRTHTPRADRVAVADVDGDGRADITVIAACEPRAGGPPDGLRPFPVVSVYTRAADGRYGNSAARDSALTDALPAGCAEGPCDVAAVARPLIARLRATPDAR